MYEAKMFIPTGINDNVMVRAVRARPYTSFDSAVAALLRSKNEGYVIEQGRSCPIYHNLKVS